MTLQSTILIEGALQQLSLGTHLTDNRRATLRGAGLLCVRVHVEPMRACGEGTTPSGAHL